MNIKAKWYALKFRIWQLKGRIIYKRCVRAAEKHARWCRALAIYNAEMSIVTDKLLEYDHSRRNAEKTG